MRPEVDNSTLKERLKSTFPIYLKGYREQVEHLYSYEHKNSETFTLTKPVKFTVLLNGYYTQVIFSFFEEDTFEIISCEHFLEEKINILIDGPVKLQKELLKDEFNIIDYINIERYFEYINELMLSTPQGLNDFAYNAGCKKADSDHLVYLLSLAFKEVTTPSIKTNVINTDEIIQRVNDAAFEYEFGESVKSYNCELYFAAAATGGASLENILRLLIKQKLSEESLPDKTYILQSLSVLRKHQIIKGRLYARITAFNAIRNSNAHTNAEPVEKEVVEDLFRIIRDVSLLLD